MKAKTPGDTLLNAKDEASLDTLDDSLAEVKAKKAGEPVTSFNAGGHAAIAESQDGWQNTGQRRDRGTARH